MSTFSTSSADQEYQLLLTQLHSLQESVVRKRKEIHDLDVEISQREQQLNESRCMLKRKLNRDEAILRDLARKLGKVP